jgi:hypothetical protein
MLRAVQFITAIVAALLLARPSHGQGTVCLNYTVDQGLSQSQVETLAEDHLG